MKRAALILLVLGLLILVALGGYLYLTRTNQVVPSEEAPETGNPFQFSTGSTGTVSGAIALKLSDGTEVSVPDFTKSNQPEWAGESAGYQVAGDADANFLITYIPADQFGAQAQFLVSLAAEPLGEVRRQAEQALIDRLGVSKEELCKLDAPVWVDDSVNATYAGRDLKLPSCPGAVILP